jgi:cell wall-associated NlpC family hydrolase
LVLARVLRPTLVVVTLALVAATMTIEGTVSAQPRKTLAQVQAELQVLETQAETASENFNAAQVDLAAVNVKVKDAQAKVARAKATVASAMETTGHMAAHAYMSGGGGMESSVGLLLSDNPTDFLDQAIAVQQVARSQNVTLRKAQEAQLQLAQAEAQLAQQQSAATAATEQMKRHRDEINQALAATTSVLAQLQAEDRKRLDALAAQQRAASAAAAAVARKAQDAAVRVTPKASSSTNSGSTDHSTPTDPSSGSGSSAGAGTARGLVAVRYALAQVGEPYSYSAQPPNSWDCSKLTTAAWAAAGVSLTPVSYAQANQVRRIPTDQLRPGDLPFYFNGAHHVAMYIGGGQIVEAASPEHGVWVTDAWNSWSSAHFSFAGRPAG